MKPFVAIAIVLAAVFVAACVFAPRHEPAPEPEIVEPTPEVKPEPKPHNPGWDKFNVWFGEHQKTCSQCSRMKDDPNQGFCLDAFQKLQEFLKPSPNDVNPPAITPVTPFPTPIVTPDVPAEPPKESPPKAASSSCSGGNCQPQRSYQSQPRRRGLLQRIFNR